jgi:hypothetical protein
MSTQTTPDGLEPYREQARELQEALTKVKAIQDQTAAVTLQRESVSKQRQGLLDSYEDESAVAELSKLASRVEMHDAKLGGLATKLASAEVDLKQALETFGTSCRNLHSALTTFLFKAALEHILSLVHPELRVRAKATCVDVAWLTASVVDAGPLRIPTLSDYATISTPDDVSRIAEQSLAKVDALLAEAAKHLEAGFVPPAAFSVETWRQSVSPSVPIAA